jgi:hypothetical protein
MARTHWIVSATNRVVRKWSLAPCESPIGLAIETAHHRRRPPMIPGSFQLLVLTR